MSILLSTYQSKPSFDKIPDNDLTDKWKLYMCVTRSGPTETGKAANCLSHTGFSGRVTIDEDQHAKYEQ